MSFLKNRILVLLAITTMVFAAGCCNKGKRKNSSSDDLSNSTLSTGGKAANSKDKKQVSDSPLAQLENTGLNYSIGAKVGKRTSNHGKGSFFEEKYVKGVDLMEKGEFGDAITLFEEIIKRYPNSEEASVAELCIAEMFFRNKSNKLALATYKRIVQQYPNSQAAENARAGITYLESFEVYEKDYISPDVEDRKRRGY
jgi:TolA-binding protein